MSAPQESPGGADEPRETRLRRLYMRSIRRGIKEMDLILGSFAATLAQLEDGELALYDRLLAENDQDLYQWVTGQAATPEVYLALVTKIAAFQAVER